MTMKTNKLFLGLATIAAAVFSFSSCSQDELSTAKAETPDPGQEILLSTNFSTTRSVAQDIQTGTQIVSGVQVGVFVATNGSTSSFVENGTNKAYTADGNGGLTAVDTDKKVYYPKTGSVDIYAYAPYQSWNVTDVNADQDFTVQADQSSDDNYKASDLIWATPQTGQASTTDALALPFVHKLSKINITINNERDGLSLKGATVYILNTKPTATINLKTGELKKESDVVVASGDVTTITAATLDAGESEPTATASAVIAPQTLAAGAKFVKIVTSATYNTTEGSTTLYAKLGTGGKTFVSGNVYKYTVTIKDNSVELSLGGTTLSGWTENEESLDAEDSDTPEVGDYIKKDGTFLKGSAITDDNKGDIVAVIFSTTSHDSGYDGYAVSIEGKLSTNNLAWCTSSQFINETTYPGITKLSEAISDYTGLGKKTAVSSSYTTYPAFECSGAPTVTGSNLSAWFIPSMGNFIEIIENLGKQSNIRSTITALEESTSSYNNISVSTALSTFLPKINKYAEDVKGTGSVIITASGDGSSDGNCFQYVTSTEKDATNMWMIKFPAQNATNQLIYLSRAASKTGTSNRNVLPIIAYKVTTE